MRVLWLLGPFSSFKEEFRLEAGVHRVHHWKGAQSFSFGPVSGVLIDVHPNTILLDSYITH